jgi:hypothetical protein
MQRAMGPHACPFLFFYFLLCEAGNEGKATPPQGDPRIPTPLPAAPAPTRWGHSNGLLVGEQAEEDFVTEQPSSFAES